jgi:cytochrome c peroxidase
MMVSRRQLYVTGVAVALSCAGCDKGGESKTEKVRQAATAQPTTAEKPKKPKVAYPPLPTPPKSLGKPKVPKDNPLTPAKVALGKKLFFDKRLSADGSRACYSCHQDADGTGGHEPLAIGAMEKQLTRHAPTMWNVAYLPRLYWDGRADSLEAQATGAWAGGNMGVGKDKLADKADELYMLDEYTGLFDEAFPGIGGTPTTIAQALASYERTLFCGDTAFDKFAAGDQSALNAEQKAGWELFSGKANCHSCHTPPFFSDAYMAEEGAYHNTGMGMQGKKKDEIDPGRQKISKIDSEYSAFKTPSLRNISKSAPYFHNGSIKTLEEAVRFMAGGGFKNPNLDAKLVDKKLTDAEIKSLVAFLGALECDGKLADK